jgi:ornithine carbamoyltransferase
MSPASLTHRIHHLTRVSDLRPETFAEILELAEMMKDEPAHCDDVLRGRAIACICDGPTAQARILTSAAAARLGATTIPVSPRDIDLGRGEQAADCARSLSGHVAAIVVATSAQETVDALARSATVPVVNAESATHAPCQALADLLTIREAFGDLEDRRLAFLGDGGSKLARSLVEACAIAGMNLTIACPPDYGPDSEVLTRARQQLDETGIEVQVLHDPRVAVAGAHAVYADAWASTGDASERRAQALHAFQVTEELLTLAQPGAVFLHCLPAARGVEVAAAVIDGPQSVVWAQSANRLPVEEAVLLLLLRGVEP